MYNNDKHFQIKCPYNVKEGTTLEFHSYYLIRQYSCTDEHNGHGEVVNIGNFQANGAETLILELLVCSWSVACRSALLHSLEIVID